VKRQNLAFTGSFVLIVLLLALAYLWQPWDQSNEPNLRLGLDLQGGLRVVLQAQEEDPLPEDLQAARRVIENRVNEFGVSEPLIQTSGDRRIVVELPGLSSEDQDRALDLIGQQAVLEFRLVRLSSAGRLAETMGEADLEPAAFTGEVLQDARADFVQGGAAIGGPVVVFDIRSQFAGEFGRFTGNNIGRRMAIVLDGNVISAPQINGRISNTGQIDGMADLEEASDLALVLRSGSLPISLEVQEIRAIGPTLGQDSIRAGTRAGLIGAGLVILAVLGYYGPLFGGVLAAGLFFAMLIIFATLAGLGAALTLPGLAGLVLTIGAAVDGNVISFERIKEELAEGRSLRLSMRNGFQNSLSAIIDANVTTLLAAAALYQYTSGPVRGFAVTLAIGIIAAVFVNTVVVPFLLNVLTLRFKKPRFIGNIHMTGFTFVKRAPIIIAVSGGLAVIALLSVAIGGLKLSTDFTGGTNALYQLPPTTTVSDVRNAIDSLDIPTITGSSATIQEVQDDTISTEGDMVMSVRVGISEDSEVGSNFATDLAEALNGSLLQADFVGPAVGADLRSAAVSAVLVALGLILAYVGWRFWPNWVIALAAIGAVLHDVGIVLGAVEISGTTFTIPVLAALLFVVGYSLNDSIIISDRIRENLRKVRNLSYEDVVDLSINQTLSRTIVTSGTTLLPVLALLFFGGSVLRGFSGALLVGIAVGTYSSIFMLAPAVVWFKTRQRVWQQQRKQAKKQRTTA
jgi:SecD/SecF fusion protein